MTRYLALLLLCSVGCAGPAQIGSFSVGVPSTLSPGEEANCSITVGFFDTSRQPMAGTNVSLVIDTDEDIVIDPRQQDAISNNNGSASFELRIRAARAAKKGAKLVTITATPKGGQAATYTHKLEIK